MYLLLQNPCLDPHEMDNGGAAIASVGADRRPSSSSTGSATSAKRRNRNLSKGLVDYTSEVSSEEFSGPEDGEVDSDGGRGRPISPVSPPPPRPAPAPNSMKLGLVENASPIDDEDFDIGMLL